MDLEFQQIDLRYEGLRKRHPQKEHLLLASLEARGQICPVVVLAQKATASYVLLDGHKRLRALKRLRQDTVRATIWDLDEAEAHLLERLMRTGGAESPLEQGWLLAELKDRFHMDLEDLGRHFDRTPSWVSRRLGLVMDLPDEVQDEVRKGRIAPHTAMKVLLPLARANRTEALRFLAVLLRAAFSTREAVVLQTGWLKGDDQVRTRILEDPRLFLRAQQTDPSALRADLRILAAVARRALGVAGVAAMPLLGSRPFRQAQSDCQALFTHLEKEFGHA
jgi:ParB/RepB/Spo0J family partition protein